MISRLKRAFIFSLLTVGIFAAQPGPHPIQFSIPECKVVQVISKKDRDFSFINPNDRSTYIYGTEEEYYKGYQRSYFAVTTKRGGWDCMRHYEILANGCIPYFVDLDQCHPNTMYFLPRDLIKEAMNLEGVSYSTFSIDHEKFNEEKYFEILSKMLAHTRQYLTTKRMAEYVLKTLNYTGTGKILFLSGSLEPDYLRCQTLSGLKELLGNRVVDFPKIPHIYKSFSGDCNTLYGKGFSYAKVIDDVFIDRENIEERIKNKEFDLIIYGSVHRGFPFYDLVTQTYEADRIAYFCGEDWRVNDDTEHICQYSHLHNFFIREAECLVKR